VSRALKIMFAPDRKWQEAGRNCTYDENIRDMKSPPTVNIIR
jgi:hypothetical protein